MVEGFDETTIQETEAAAIDFEEKLIPVVEEKFLNVNKDELYRRDIISSGYMEEIFSDEVGLNTTRFIRRNNYEIVQTDFDLAFLELSGTQLKTGFELLLDSRQEGNHMAIVPECYGFGNSITNPEELDMLIMKGLEEPRTLPGLLQSMSDAFAPEELEDAGDAFRELIFGRIKMGLWYKIIEPVGTGPESESETTDELNRLRISDEKF